MFILHLKEQKPQLHLQESIPQFVGSPLNHSTTEINSYFQDIFIADVHKWPGSHLQTSKPLEQVCVCVFVALASPLAEILHLQFCRTEQGNFSPRHCLNAHKHPIRAKHIEDTDKQQSVCKYAIKLLKWVEFFFFFWWVYTFLHQKFFWWDTVKIFSLNTVDQLLRHITDFIKKNKTKQN